jgi:hypothetical protein
MPRHRSAADAAKPPFVKRRKVRNRRVMQSDPGSMVASMTGVSRSDGGGARARASGTRRAGWFSRATYEVGNEDQESEVRAQLYAKRAESERTVRRVEPIQPASRVEWLDRSARIDRSEPIAPAVERVAERPAA